MTNEIMVRITYQLRTERDVRSLDLPPEAYLELAKNGDSVESDAIPRFDHAYQYTGYSADELKWTLLEGGPEKGSIVRTQFLDGLRSMMTHRADSDGYEEIIHSTMIELGGLLVLRTVKMPGQAWSVVMSNYSVNDSLGVSKQVGWSPDELAAFCRVGVRAY